MFGTRLQTNVMRAIRLTRAALCLVLLFSTQPSHAESRCFGTTEDGYLEGAVKLPLSGRNFSVYGRLPAMLGRTYVHSIVHTIVLDAFAELGRNRPGTHYVYGETGRKGGGPFKPHKTHRNGLSVDFMVPVRDLDGRSVPLPTGPLNRWGYDFEFDSHGRAESLRIDFPAMGEHLVALHRAALASGVELRRVILAPDLQRLLYATPSGRYIRQHIKIPTRRSWVRHDDHYHVDFSVPCRALNRSDR